MRLLCVAKEEKYATGDMIYCLRGEQQFSRKQDDFFAGRWKGATYAWRRSEFDTTDNLTDMYYLLPSPFALGAMALDGKRKGGRRGMR